MSEPEKSRMSYLMSLLLDSMIEDEDSLLNRNIKESKAELSSENAKRKHDEKAKKIAVENITKDYHNNFIQKIVLLNPEKDVKVGLNYLIQLFNKN